MQGYFTVKITPIGVNIQLLEEQDERNIQMLITDAQDSMKHWFKEIRPWSPKDVDIKKVIWLRIHGVPTHAWNLSLLSFII